MDKKCTNCNTALKDRFKIKFCSNRCQFEHQYKRFIYDWKMGVKNGIVGISVKSISRHIYRFLMERNGESCSKCGWHIRHQITGKIPLEVDHIDGNSENNNENNLRLLCPNCHSLTPYFRNLNRGNGRKWRIEKYREGRVLDVDSIPY